MGLEMFFVFSDVPVYNFRQTREQRNREEKTDRTLLRNIIATWKSIRVEREKQQYTNTQVKLQIRKLVVSLFTCVYSQLICYEKPHLFLEMLKCKCKNIASMAVIFFLTKCHFIERKLNFLSDFQCFDYFLLLMF